ncbi:MULTISPECIES: low temperature requirement protein A [unclassified Mumia]|uniref:low temperature requirement protein A n=1 Tax=unclassified Mumia TaxID=2621872 RepID=UPI00261D0847|nr:MULTISPECIES: low temperature requirement protein A [unclassified Mumia]MDD9350153.1 low temperature requirement protein A [Mumia sp.]
MPTISSRVLGLRARDPGEPHRAATPLELLTDLCFVVAVAQAATQLHHATTDGDLAHGLLRFAMVFFAIWWTWLNFAWFASAYDDDGVAYRLLTILQIVGALVLAAGIPRMFDGDLGLIVVGYVIMRVGLVVQWLRAAAGDPQHRASCLRFAAGITAVQLLWVVYLVSPRDIAIPEFAVFVVCELVVPVWAERPNQTSWHAHHIAERYGLFFIIVLGETILSVTLAIQESVDAHDVQRGLAYVSVGGVLIVFSVWWIYFARDSAAALERARGTGAEYVWGFGHYAVFASAAAIGAALAARVDFWQHEVVHGHVVESWPSAALLCGSVAVLLAACWVVKVRPEDRSAGTAARWGAAITAVLLLVLAPLPEVGVGLVCVILLVTELYAGSPRGRVRAAPEPE